MCDKSYPVVPTRIQVGCANCERLKARIEYVETQHDLVVEESYQYTNTITHLEARVEGLQAQVEMLVAHIDRISGKEQSHE